MIDHLPVEKLSISSLLRGDSPRLSGEDSEHIRALAQLDDRLPPIVVHRPTMRVIDGMHRLRAALLRGDRWIHARCFDGDAREAFVLAVQSNTAHGLPLTLADRSAAAARILRSYPHWSDRAVAAATGLSAATVAAIRHRGSNCSAPDSRIGLDGRARPLNSADGRRLASTLFVQSPGVSLREVARAAGISPATAQNVRDRLRRGEDPVPPKQRAGERTDTSRLNGAATNDTVAVVAPGPTVAFCPTHEPAPAPATSPLTESPAPLEGAPCPDTPLAEGPSAGSRPGRGARILSALRNRRIATQPTTVLRGLRSDPSIRFNEEGRELLMWLTQHVLEPEECAGLVDHVPTHSTKTVAELARACAQIWGCFAEELEERSKAAGLMEPGRI